VSAPLLGIVDYGMGNRRSVEKALAHVGARAAITRDHDELRAAGGLVVPGVGAFPRAMANLRELGLDELLAERLHAGVPVLGICLGMQLAFESSTELGGSAGLGWVPGEVSPLAVDGRKLPHIGWSLVRFTRPSPLTAGLPAECAFYHVHSFAAHPAEQADALGFSEYGEEFVSAFDVSGRTGLPLYGVQFHPEKSSRHGLRLLENFATLAARGAARAAA
jgi:glutamine amidotransferase